MNPGEKRKLAAYSTVGLMFPISIGVGWVMGHYLDQWLKTSPYLTFLFVLYGAAAGFRNLYKVTKKKHHENNENNQQLPNH